jgi:hypothetical protein
LETVMKTWPRKMPETFCTENRRWASGESAASSAARYSRVEPGSTGLPGMNFRVAGLGVASV